METTQIPKHIQERIKAGQEAERKRRTEEATGRLLRFDRLRHFVGLDLEADLLPFADVNAEQPDLFPDYHCRILIPGLAELRACYGYHCGDWKRFRWGAGYCGLLWAVLPRPGTPTASWHYVEDLDAALALAAELSLGYHAVRQEDETPTELSRRPWWQRLRCRAARAHRWALGLVAGVPRRH